MARVQRKLAALSAIFIRDSLIDKSWDKKREIKS